MSSLFLFLQTAQADTVLLKNEKQIKGLVVERHHDRIILSTERGEIPILMSGIKDIAYDDPEQNFFQIGRALEQEKKWGEALAYYEKALEINPAFDEARKAALAVQNRFWAESAEGPADEIARKQMLLDAWKRGVAGTGFGQQSEEQSNILRKQLGMALEKKGDWTRAQTVLPGKPAAVAGLRKGDYLVAVDGQSLRYLGVDAVTKKILGARHANFTVDVERRRKLKKQAGEKAEALGLSMDVDYAGLAVSRVRADSEASRAGLREGDLIVEVEGHPTRYLPIKEALRMMEHTSKDQVDLRIRRSCLLSRR